MLSRSSRQILSPQKIKNSIMRSEKKVELELLQAVSQSFTEVCVPQLMSLAAQNKPSIQLLLRDTPGTWKHADRVLAAVIPSFRKDVEAFYSGKGKPMCEMFDSHQLVSIDRGAREVLLDKLSGMHRKR